MYYYSYPSPYGNLVIHANDDAITCIHIGNAFGDDKELETELIKEAYHQLQEYFDGVRTCFNLPLAPSGTPFQQRVWKALCDIPYGEVRSYKQIAIACGNEKACRAVGMANNKNPIPIIIPCHRVIGANGKMVGYAFGLDMKQSLLHLEKKEPVVS